MRNLFVLFGIFIIAANSRSALANGISAPSYTNMQDAAADFSTWKKSVEEKFTTYEPSDKSAMVIAVLGDKDNKSEFTRNRISILFAAMNKFCPGMESIPYKLGDSYIGQAHSVGDTLCNFLVGTDKAGNWANVLTIEREKGSRQRYRMGAHIFFEMTKGAGLGPNVGANNAPPVQSAPNDKKPLVPSTNSKVSTSLKSAIDRIPKDRRPIGLVYSEGPYDAYNASVTFRPHLLFPNGIMISPNCTAWDPAKPITADSAMGCGFERYRLEGRTAYFKGESESIDDYQGFKKGEMVSVNFSNTGGLSSAVPNSGSSAVWGGELTMTPHGKISVGSWSGATVSGSGFGAYGGSNKQGVSGDYYLDGYLIGVQDAKGNVGVSFIWQQDGQHIFLGGEQYNR
jgi:hypothetical protein